MNNGPGASRRRPRRTRKISGPSADAPFACYTFLELVLNLQNSRSITLVDEIGKLSSNEPHAPEFRSLVHMLFHGLFLLDRQPNARWRCQNLSKAKICGMIAKLLYAFARARVREVAAG